MDVKVLAVVLGALLFLFTAPTPVINSVTPNNGVNINTVEVMIDGAKFAKDVTVKLSRTNDTDIPAISVKVLSGQKISCIFDLKGKQVGKWDLVVTNKKSRSAKLTEGFVIGSPVPQVNAVTPGQGTNNTLLGLVIKGAAFRTGASVMLTNRQMDIGASKIKVLSDSQISCEVNINQADPGIYNVKVINDDGAAGILADGFKIVGPPQPAVEVVKPVITEVTPNKGFNNGMILTRIDGKCFEAGSTVKLSRNGQNDLPGLNTKVVDKTLITCFFDITGQPEGKYNVEVTNPSGQKAFLADGFTVESFKPVLADINKKIKPIYFDVDKADLRSNQAPVLEADLAILNSYPQLFIILGGHTDERGGIEYNLELSEKRANMIKNYLVAKGIDAKKITIYAYGKEFPVAKGHNESSWWQNRRVEIKVWEAPAVDQSEQGKK